MAKVAFGFHALAVATQWFHATVVDDSFEEWLGPIRPEAEVKCRHQFQTGALHLSFIFLLHLCLF